MAGDPDRTGSPIRATLSAGPAPACEEIANDARNVRLLERGNLLRKTLANRTGGERGRYRRRVRHHPLAFVQEHFATAAAPETGVS